MDVLTIREPYTRMDLSAVAWVHSENNPIDSLTKPKENAAFISDIFLSLHS